MRLVKAPSWLESDLEEKMESVEMELLEKDVELEVLLCVVEVKMSLLSERIWETVVTSSFSSFEAVVVGLISFVVLLWKKVSLAVSAVSRAFVTSLMRSSVVATGESAWRCSSICSSAGVE